MRMQSFEIDSGNRLIASLEDQTEVIFTEKDVVIQGPRGKGLFQNKMISEVLLRREEGFFTIILCVSPDHEWNEMMKKRHPIRSRVGLVKKYKGSNVVLFSVGEIRLLDIFEGELIRLGFKVRK